MTPKLTGILETCLYVDDLDRAQTFYEKIFGLTLVNGAESGRLRVLQVSERQLLLLFRRGGSPDHDGAGQNHLAFSIPAAELPGWERWLAENNLPIVEHKKWQYGGESLYFRDPDGHLLEVATPGTWPVY